MLVYQRVPPMVLKILDFFLAVLIYIFLISLDDCFVMRVETEKLPSNQ
jgi:hypothetical protein